jgi:hypothetical protein
MARITTTFKANTLAALQTLVNTYFAPLVGGASVFLLGVDLVLNDEDRRLGTEYQATITVDDNGAAAQSDPYELVLFAESNATDLDAAYAAYYTANPAIFTTAARNISRLTPSRLTQLTTWLIACDDAVDGAANYTPL